MIEKQEKQQLIKTRNGGSFGIRRNKIKNIIFIFLLVSNVLTIPLANVYIEYKYPRGVIPEHPTNIPSSAVWRGDHDGGCFYDLVDIKDDIYRIRIYNEHSGKILMDSDFKLEPFVMTQDNFHEMSPYYYYYGTDSSSYIDLHVPMHLKAIYPAYGGADWEIIKEKYKLEY